MPTARVPVRASRIADDVFDRIRALTVRRRSVPSPDPDAEPGATIDRSALDDLEVRTRRLIEADAMPARADGWSSTTPGNGSPGGGKGGGATILIPVPKGERMAAVIEGLPAELDRVPVSSTERAVLTGSRPDPVHAMAVEVMDAARRVARHLERWEQTLARFERLRSTAALADPPMCHVAKGLGFPWDPVWQPWRATDFAGVLAQPWPEPRDVCEVVYRWVRNHRELPGRADLRGMLDRETRRAERLAVEGPPLDAVRQVVRMAEAEGVRPLQAVRDAFDLGRADAADLITAARSVRS